MSQNRGDRSCSRHSRKVSKRNENEEDEDEDEGDEDEDEDEDKLTK